MSHPLSEKFQTFAESECHDSSPLYEALSRAIAQDDLLLEIAGHAKSGQPVPNLFFAAVHYLISSGISHPLSAFYATCTNSPAAPEEATPAFRDFALTHRQDIIALLESHLVQTNEVRRSAYLFPALSFAASQFEPRPLALIEIGTSAGLNLLWDRYQYSYGNSATYGNASSPVLVTSSFRGSAPAILSAAMPRVSHRIGLDLNIVDTSIPDQANWLRALIWPEHHDRRALMEASLERRSEFTLDLRAGNGFAMAAELAQEIPEDSLLCIYHTHVANQISSEARTAFLSSIDQIGTHRDVIHVFNNIKPSLHLTAYRNRKLIDLPLAHTDGHARWIEWLADLPIS